MNIGVTGGTGFIGKVVLRQLAAKGHTVSALIRSAGGQTPAGCRIVAGDVRDPQALDRLVAEADAVVHLAAYVHREPASASERRECFAVNEGGAELLIAALERSGRRPFVVLMSTAAVYGSEFVSAQETDVCRPASPYAESKLRSERLLLAAIEGGRARGTILRPPLVIGPGMPGNLQRLLRWMDRGFFPLIAGGRNAKSLVGVQDLATAVLACLEHQKACNRQILNVAAQPPLSMRQIAEALVSDWKRAPLFVPLPRWLAVLGANTSRAGHRLTRGVIPDLRRTVDTFCSSNSLNTTRLERTFSPWQPQTSLLALAQLGARAEHRPERT